MAARVCFGWSCWFAFLGCLFGFGCLMVCALGFVGWLFELDLCILVILGWVCLSWFVTFII